jgi:hypothetical protein
MFENKNPFDESNKTLAKAIEYINHGFPVFPIWQPTENGCSCGNPNCHSIGKHPMTKNGHKAASTDINQITKWFENYDANIGIPTGKDTFYVLDIDITNDKKGMESLNQLIKDHGELPECLVATTGSGGKHFCFESKEELPNRINFMPGIDFKGEGGYIVVEPSKHFSGGTYRFENLDEYIFMEDNQIPDWLVNLVKNKKSKTKNLTNSQPDIHNISAVPIRHGTRTDTLMRLGCSLREINGADEIQLCAALKGINQTLPEPMEESEVRDLAANICKNYPAGKKSNQLNSEIPESNLSEYVDELFEGYKQKDRNELIGMPLKKFKQLAASIDGIQDGFYLIPGEAAAGKTMYLINLFLDIINSNEVSGYYISLDDPRKTIINRMLACLSGVSINNLQKLKGNGLDIQQIQFAKGLLQKSIKQDKLNLFDISQIQNIEQIKKMSEKAKRERRKFFIAIDGTYNLSVGKYQNARDENIQRANKLKEIADVFEIPVICTGEVRKDIGKGTRDLSNNDIMESGKYIYNPNLITILTKVFDEQKKPISNQIQLYCSKNKLSSFDGNLILNIKKDICLVTEQPEVF